MRGAIRAAAVAIWLFVVAALVLAMVVVGGATRLTDSGLSITEWKPITGAIPPLNARRLAGRVRQVPGRSRSTPRSTPA